MESWDYEYAVVQPYNIAPLIEPNHPSLTISRQAELLGVDRQAFYYSPTVSDEENARLKLHMNAVDAIYTDYPFYGSRRMKNELMDRFGLELGRARIRTVMRRLGLEAVYPKPNTSKPGTGTAHKIYPYLLRNVTAAYPNHIWGTDITYIKTADGFVYLVALLDWHSRYVVSWGLSDTLHNGFVLKALHDALQLVDDCGLSPPDISNTDQGSHFTAQAFIEMLKQAGVQISMDGRGRCMDNIFTERLWRSVKYENVFLKSHQSIEDATEGIDEYFWFYNNKRRHQSLDYATPASVYFDIRNDPKN